MTAEKIVQGLWRLELPTRTLPPFASTNTYLVTDSGVGVLVDAGFHDPEILESIRGLLERAGVTFLKALLLTHTHADHIAGLTTLRGAYPDLAIYVHPTELPRLEDEGALALQGERHLTVGNRTLRTLHTPGHSPGSLSFVLPDANAALVGDLLAARGSTWVGLPEGDLNDYLNSLAVLEALNLDLLGPGHGPAVREPARRLGEVRAHRLARVEQVYQALGDTPKTLTQLRSEIYPEVAPELHDLTERSLLAILKVLMNGMRVLHVGNDKMGPYAQRA